MEDVLLQSFTDFIETSQDEYEELKALCDELAFLTHSIDACSSGVVGSEYKSNEGIVPVEWIKISQPSRHLYKYQNYCESIRILHQELHLLSSQMEKSTDQGQNTPQNHQYHEYMKSHIRLSQRVIRTCTLGRIDSVGILRDDMNQYDNRLVALAALNASIKRIEGIAQDFKKHLGE